MVEGVGSTRLERWAPRSHHFRHFLIFHQVELLLPMLDEPLDDPTIRRLSREILRHGVVEFTSHALDEMAD